MNNKPPAAFGDNEWKIRQVFIRNITAAAQAEAIAIEWLSEYWVIRLKKRDKTIYVISHHFPVNSSPNALLARDKVAAYYVLREQGLPIISHWLVRFTPENSIDKIAETALQAQSLPLVLKPCDSGGGHDVYKVTTHDELATTLGEMALHYRTIAASPFETIQNEFRIVLLDNQVLLAYEKILQKGEWRHNLYHGAATEPIANGVLKTQLIALAKKAATALGLRLAAVDIVTTPEGLKIMEVNAGITFNKLSSDPRFETDVAMAYRAILRTCFAHTA